MAFFFRRAIFDELPEDSDYIPAPEDRPGGFEWGNQNQNVDPQDNPQ